MPDNEPTKRCSRCGEEKPLDAFNRSNRTVYTLNGAVSHRPGLQAYCRHCQLEYGRAYQDRLQYMRRRLHA